MGTWEQLKEVLQANGGWGLAAVFAIVIWRLVVYIRDQHKERIREQGDTIKLLEGVKNSLAGNEKALDRFTEKLDRVERQQTELLAERRA